MDALKKYWPFAEKVKKGDVVSLIINLVILLVACALVSWLVFDVIGGILPFIAGLLKLVGLALDIYGLVGIILCILKFVGKF